MPDTSVKWFASNMTSAPALTASAGTMANVLDACLVNGFGTVTLDSVVVSGAVATCTKSAGHGFTDQVIALLAGATPAGLNGEKRITVVSSTVFTFVATGISNQTATGTITAKMAPAGWEIQYTGTSLRAYRSTDLSSSRFVCRISDVWTSVHWTGIGLFRTMSDINTGVDGMGDYWRPNVPLAMNYYAFANSTWVVVADGRFFYVLATSDGAGSNANLRCLSYFGDFLSMLPVDAYAVAVGGMSDYPHSTGSCDGVSVSPANLYKGIRIARASDQVTVGPYALQLGSRIDARFGRGPVSYPDPQTGGLLLHPVYLREVTAGGTAQSVRGQLPGFYQVLQTAPLSHLSITSGPGGRQILLVAGGTTANNAVDSNDGRYAFDITGPWR